MQSIEICTYILLHYSCYRYYIWIDVFPTFVFGWFLATWFSFLSAWHFHIRMTSAMVFFKVSDLIFFFNIYKISKWCILLLIGRHIGSQSWKVGICCAVLCEENSLVAQLRIDFVLKLCYLIHNCMLNTLFWDIRANFVP